MRRRTQFTGHDPRDIDRIIAERKEREIQAARENPLPKVGRPAKEKNASNRSISTGRVFGTTRTYTLRRLARDRPDLLKKVEKGKLSANAVEGLTKESKKWCSRIGKPRRRREKMRRARYGHIIRVFSTVGGSFRGTARTWSRNSEI